MLGFLPVIALALAFVHIALDKKLRTAKKIIETVLLYELVIATGLGGIFGFMGHSMRAAEIAKFIGWRAGSPFQLEVAVANLAFGVLGILCYWLRGNFWLATIIGTTVFGWGAAYVHIMDIINRNNLKPGNAGLVLYLDIIMPIVMIGLYVSMGFADKIKLRRGKKR